MNKSGSITYVVKFFLRTVWYLFPHTASTGTVEASVPQQERDLCCVSETLAMRLAAVAIHVEKAYRSPRDIEFAVVNVRVLKRERKKKHPCIGVNLLDIKLKLKSLLASNLLNRRLYLTHGTVHLSNSVL